MHNDDDFGPCGVQRHSEERRGRRRKTPRPISRALWTAVCSTQERNALKMLSNGLKLHSSPSMNYSAETQVEVVECGCSGSTKEKAGRKMLMKWYKAEFAGISNCADMCLIEYKSGRERIMVAWNIARLWRHEQKSPPRKRPSSTTSKYLLGGGSLSISSNQSVDQEEEVKILFQSFFPYQLCLWR